MKMIYNWDISFQHCLLLIEITVEKLLMQNSDFNSNFLLTLQLWITHGLMEWLFTIFIQSISNFHFNQGTLYLKHIRFDAFPHKNGYSILKN